MTTPTNPIERLVTHWLTQPSLSTATLDELIPALAASPAALAELTALSSALTGEPSTLQVAVERLHAYQAGLELLDAYAEAELAGVDPALLYPTVAEQLRTYPRFRQQYEQLLATLRADAQGDYGIAPSDMNFAEWFAQQQPASVSAPAPQAPVWQQVAQGINRLVAEIPIWFHKGRATFGQLPDRLTPQLAPALVYRQRTAPTPQPDGEDLTTVWELPLLVSDRIYKLRLGAVENQRGALILEAAQRQPPQPIAGVRVTLHDHEGELLEGATTSEQGIALFRNLEVGKYSIQIEHADQVDEFSVALQQAP